jgi:Fe-S-cluster containining protein
MIPLDFLQELKYIKHFEMNTPNKQYTTDLPGLKPNSMKCLRCGICCHRHQAIITLKELQRIVSYLNITELEWEREYSEPKWPSDKNRLIRHVNGACVFLKYTDNVSYCDIQPVKPSCCKEWMPGLDKKECLEGLAKNGGS